PYLQPHGVRLGSRELDRDSAGRTSAEAGPMQRTIGGLIDGGSAEGRSWHLRPSGSLLGRQQAGMRLAGIGVSRRIGNVSGALAGGAASGSGRAMQPGALDASGSGVGSLLSSSRRVA